MEKIEFFRPRYIEQDGSMSVGFWMCENKKVDDGYFYRAADVDALLSDVRRLVEAARRSYESMYAINERTHPMDFSKKLIQLHNLLTSADELEKAIAAVERHLLKE